jgi:hypothetical protein
VEADLDDTSARQALRDPGARFLQRLTLRCAHRTVDDLQDLVSGFAVHQPRWPLRALALSYDGFAQAAKLGALVSRFPYLETLTLNGSVRLNETPTLPALTTLTIGELQDARWLDLARAPALRALTVTAPLRTAGEARLLRELVAQRPGLQVRARRA